ncbi:MAG: DUF1634 domain-containing protein [Gemmatimonadetes bacterium]|nr:DUF1634 domain-containing protein [Gemmatimonadota bacterium]NNM04419.1 DUF1634 domain-containing protein [Gemmatimonadota bacterium]
MTETEKNMATDPAQASGPQASGEADADQLLYAGILAKGMYLGLAILTVTFIIYMTGIVQPGVPIEELPRLWTLSVHDYTETINHEFLHRPGVVIGWSWVGLVGMADFMNFIGIAVLSAVTVVCYMGILPSLFRKKDWIYAAIAAVEVIVLALAASGLVAVGH